ncbi:MAG: GNAT family N-acetyltransferase, partial [Candidatus Hodarchaeota archaeon]
MLNYPEEWTKQVTLKNGVEVSLRPELPSDTDMLWEMFSTLSKSTLDQLIPPFTREKIENWTSNIDYNRHLPILAFVREGSSDRIIGSDSISFHHQEIYRHKADLGITVHDDYQD